MDTFGKLFQKITKKEQLLLLIITEQLLMKDNAIWHNVKKVRGSDFYRLRKGRFRLIFHIERGEVVIDSIKLRNENTYKGL